MFKYMHYFNSAPFKKVGLSNQQVSDISIEINRWLKSCGPEWTVSRLKEYKLMAINKFTGATYQPPWISTSHGIPKGAVGVLFKRDLSFKVFRKVIDALMVYTSIINVSAPTRKQTQKFLSSVMTDKPNVMPPINLELLTAGIDDIKSFSSHVEFKSTTYRDIAMSPVKRSCDSMARSAPMSYERLVDDFRTSIIWDALDDDDMEGFIADAMDNLYPMLRKVPEDIDNHFVGRVSTIQERGMKARFVAIPRLTFQCALYPLGRFLLDICKCIPWDCTHDQKKGLDWGALQLSTGKRLWSVDLSDFTNHWPFKFIEWTLHQFDEIPKGIIKLFQFVSQKDYILSNLTIQWKRGTPLGTYPSFPAAAISHGLVLRSIEILLGVQDSFRVLGDDILISDKQVSETYLSILKSWDIPISESKTLIERSIGEFAGGLITPFGHFKPRKSLIPTLNNVGEVHLSHMENNEIKSARDLYAIVVKIMKGEASHLTLDRKAVLLSQFITLKPETVIKKKDNTLQFLWNYRQNLFADHKECKEIDHQQEVVLSRSECIRWYTRTKDAFAQNCAVYRKECLQTMKIAEDVFYQCDRVYVEKFADLLLRRGLIPHIDTDYVYLTHILFKMLNTWFTPSDLDFDITSRRMQLFICTLDQFINDITLSAPTWNKVMNTFVRNQILILKSGRNMIKQRFSEMELHILDNISID
jgi:hypothetical protein